MARKIKLAKVEEELGIEFAECVDTAYVLKRRDLKLTPAARLKCMSCGSYRRKKTCPPFAPSLKKAKRLIKKCDRFILIIARNDGTKAWWLGDDPQRAITLEKKRERELKGTNMGMQMYCTRLMKEVKRKLKKTALVWGAGPCHRCRDCKGMKVCPESPAIPCMEAWGMSVYGMLDKLKIPYQHPVKTELVAVNLIGFIKEG